MGNNFKLPKSERLHSRRLTDDLFTGSGSHAMSAFPLRLVFKSIDNLSPDQMMVSVPKRCLHRANKRNRVKRQLREAYRKHKELVAGSGLVMAFIWLDNKIYPSDVVEDKVVSLLTRLSEKLNGINDGR